MSEREELNVWRIRALRCGDGCLHQRVVSAKKQHETAMPPLSPFGSPCSREADQTACHGPDLD